MKLNEKIYYYRKRAKLSQEELAAQVGVSRQAVSKWELGDATPEVDKLLALARAFGVTADELLSENVPEEPQSRPEPEPEPGPRPYSYYDHSPVDRTFGILGHLVQRFGWLAGVYVALSGLGVTLVGALARFAFGRMFSIVVNDMFGGYGGGWSVAVEGMDSVPPEIMNALAGQLGGVHGGFGDMTAVTGMGQIFITIATVILVVGLCITVAGVALAIYLYRKGRNG